MLSAVIASYFIDDKKPLVLKACVNSLRGNDETVVFATRENMGFCFSWNQAASMARGDYMVFIGDNNYLVEGDLSDLAIPGTVTSPLIDGKASDFWGFVFCMPREVYEKIGLYDMDFNDGVHFMDDDLKRRIERAGIPMRSVSTVNFHHPEGGRTINQIKEVGYKIGINSEIFNKKWQQQPTK